MPLLAYLLIAVVCAPLLLLIMFLGIALTMLAVQALFLPLHLVGRAVQHVSQAPARRKAARDRGVEEPWIVFDIHAPRYAEYERQRYEERKQLYLRRLDRRIGDDDENPPIQGKPK